MPNYATPFEYFAPNVGAAGRQREADVEGAQARNAFLRWQLQQKEQELMQLFQAQEDAGQAAERLRQPPPMLPRPPGAMQGPMPPQVGQASVPMQPPMQPPGGIHMPPQAPPMAPAAPAGPPQAPGGVTAPPAAPIQPYQTLPRPAREPLGGQATPTGEVAPPPPSLTFEGVAGDLYDNGVRGARLWRALNEMAPRMDAQFKQYVQLLNQEVASLKQQLAAGKAEDKPPAIRTIRRGEEEVQQEYDPTTKTWSEVGAGPKFRPEKPTEGLPKPKSGWMWNDEGTEQFMIQGGPAWQKVKETSEKDEKNKRLMHATLDAEIRNIDKLIGSEDGKIKPHPGVNAMVGSIDPYIPTLRTNTANAEALLRSLQSKASISSLMTIRGSAGAIGQLTEKEWPRLEAMKAALTEKQGEDQFKQGLKEYRDELKRMKAMAQENIDMAYAEFRSAQPPGGSRTRSQARPLSDYVEIRTTKDGRRLGKKADGTIEVIGGGR